MRYRFLYYWYCELWCLVALLEKTLSSMKWTLVFNVSRTSTQSYLFTSFAKGLDFIKEHPEARAEDLIHAFSDDSIDMISMRHWKVETWYLSLTTLSFEMHLLQKVINQNFSWFLGYDHEPSQLYKLGIKIFTANHLADTCELDKEMLPYSLQISKKNWI